jgi:hypothetical protein
MIALSIQRALCGAPLRLHGCDRKPTIVARHEENAHEHYQHNRLR